VDLEAKLYMIFDMLGDIPRTGPLIWKVDRARTEDIKDHIFDLIIMVKILQKHFPPYIDIDKIIEYALVHDLEEAITGDITAFEGISKEEKTRRNAIAMNYLIEKFGSILDFKTLMIGYEKRIDIESHILHMLDKVQSSIPFIKYDSEHTIDRDSTNIIEPLRNCQAVQDGRKRGMSVSEIFYEYHLKSVVITDEQIKKYGISESDARKIENAIKAFMKCINVEARQIGQICSDFPKM